MKIKSGFLNRYKALSGVIYTARILAQSGPDCQAQLQPDSA